MGIILAVSLAISPQRILVEVVKTERLCDRVELTRRRNRVWDNVRGVYLLSAPPDAQFITRMK